MRQQRSFFGGGVAMAAAALALAVLAGCAGRPHADIRYEAGGPDTSMAYDSATFQIAKDEKIQVVFYHQVAAPIGVADPDFEYVFFELPERSTYGWLREDRVPVYRWVRTSGHDAVWLGSDGQVRTAVGDPGGKMDFRFRVRMDPVVGAEGKAHLLSGHFRVAEDPLRTQGFINKYGAWLGSLIHAKPPAPPPAKKKKSPLLPGEKKSSSTSGAAAP